MTTNFTVDAVGASPRFPYLAGTCIPQLLQVLAANWLTPASLSGRLSLANGNHLTWRRLA